MRGLLLGMLSGEHCRHLWGCCSDVHVQEHYLVLGTAQAPRAWETSYTRGCMGPRSLAVCLSKLSYSLAREGWRLQVEPDRTWSRHLPILPRWTVPWPDINLLACMLPAGI